MEQSWHADNSHRCPMVSAMNVVGGKWKPVIVHLLSVKTMRFGELKRRIPPVSQKMLTQQLRELEIDGIVTRTVYAEVPPRVEYALTPIGQSLSPILTDLYAWGEQHLHPKATTTGRETDSHMIHR